MIMVVVIMIVVVMVTLAVFNRAAAYRSGCRCKYQYSDQS